VQIPVSVLTGAMSNNVVRNSSAIYAKSGIQVADEVHTCSVSERKPSRRIILKVCKVQFWQFLDPLTMFFHQWILQIPYRVQIKQC